VRHQGDVVPMLYGLLHSPPGPARDAQQQELRARSDLRTGRAGARLRRSHGRPQPMLRLPLAALRFPQLRRRPRAELRAFMDTVYALVHADGRGRPVRVLPGPAAAHAGCRGDGSFALVGAGDRRLAGRRDDAGGGDAAGGDRAGRAREPADAPRAYLAGLGRVYPRLNTPYAPPADLHAALDESGRSSTTSIRWARNC
jgi:hypothetical protein